MDFLARGFLFEANEGEELGSIAVEDRFREKWVTEGDSFEVDGADMVDVTDVVAVAAVVAGESAEVAVTTAHSFVEEVAGKSDNFLITIGGLQTTGS